MEMCHTALFKLHSFSFYPKYVIDLFLESSSALRTTPWVAEGVPQADKARKPTESCSFYINGAICRCGIERITIEWQLFNILIT